MKMGEASSDNCSSWRNALHGASAMVPWFRPRVLRQCCVQTFPPCYLSKNGYSSLTPRWSAQDAPHTHQIFLYCNVFGWFIFASFPFSVRDLIKKLIDTILNQMLACKIFPFLKWAIAAEYQFPKAGLQGVGTSCQAISASLPAPKQWASCVHSTVCVTSLNFWQGMLVNYVWGLFKYLLC